MENSQLSPRDIRHIDKSAYLGVNDSFYEPFYDHYIPSKELLEIAESFIGKSQFDWHVHTSGVWTHIVPDYESNNKKGFLADQGWKIHISATNKNCREILSKVTHHLIEEGIQFKFANDVETLRLMTSKRWWRGGSGKFMTIYPWSISQFKDIIEKIYSTLKGLSGSYILSDRRYKDSKCVYYRYGQIRSIQRLDCFGRKLEVIKNPNGDEIEDLRTPYFQTPDWAPDPFPEETSSPDEDMTLDNGRYTIESALAFSNTGGVYLGIDNNTEKKVVIKEARPGVELSPDGHDATHRLAQEAKMLQIVGGAGIVPEVYGTFQDWENSYLVEEYFDGVDIRGIMLGRTPLLKVNPTKKESEEFYEIFTSIFKSILNAVSHFHSKDVVIGDLSPVNILINEDTFEIRIIDLEGAFRPSLDVVQEIHTPGFRPEVKGRDKANNYKDDLYAVGVIMMYSMFPIVALAFLREDIFDSILPTLVKDIGWSFTPVTKIIQGLVSGKMSSEKAIALLDNEFRVVKPKHKARSELTTPCLTDTSEQISQFICKNYRLDDIYTLFPIDPFGAISNPLGFAFGATGILHGLEKNGFEVPGPAMERYNTELAALDVTSLSPGFLVGTAGMAWAFIDLGDKDRGRKFLNHANSSDLARDHHSLYYGMAGIGMINLVAYKEYSDETFLQAAVSLAEELLSSALENERGIYWENNGSVQLGLGYGQSGVALFFLRLAQITKNSEWRAIGRKALNFDISYAEEIESGVMSITGSRDEKDTPEQYIEQGSGGIAKVALRYGLVDEVVGFLNDNHRKYSGFSGLIYGLSGFVDVLTDAYIYTGDKKYLSMAERPLNGLFDLYLYETENGYAAPGENLFRISCDFATGLTGISRTLIRRQNLAPDDLFLDWVDFPKEN